MKYREWLNNGNTKTKAGLSSNTVNNIIAVIQGSIKMAHMLGYTKENASYAIKRPRIDEHKTESSKRIIPLPKQLLPRLKHIQKNTHSEFVISNGTSPISVRSYQRTFELLLKKLSIKHRGFHSLRHTFATRALECGMDVKTLSEILGHKNPTVTLNRYTHSLLEHKIAMMNRVGKLL